MRLIQVYGEPGVPLAVEADIPELLSLLRAHRTRMLGTFRSLSPDDWRRETRCTGWDARHLADHLTGATRFFTATLDRARHGEATRLIEGFDPRESPAELARQMGDRPAGEVLEELEAADASFWRVIDEYEHDPRGLDVWTVTAEGPPGHYAASQSLQHMFFDSWLHERDLTMALHLGGAPDPREAAAVAAYLLGLAALASLLTLDPRPFEGETIAVELDDAESILCASVGVPTVVRTISLVDSEVRTPPATVVCASATHLAEAMSGRDHLDTLVEPTSRAYAVLGGALPFLSDPVVT
jgi:uncharacterized protein (TIGR03083 family)